jgi:hypothetical protein
MGDLDPSPTLIEGLDSDRKEVRYLCHEALKTATGHDYGYDHLDQNQQELQIAVLRWRQWWGEYSGDSFFATSYQRKYSIGADLAAPGGETKPIEKVLDGAGTEPGQQNPTPQDPTPQNPTPATPTPPKAEVVEPVTPPVKPAVETPAKPVGEKQPSTAAKPSETPASTGQSAKAPPEIIDPMLNESAGQAKPPAGQKKPVVELPSSGQKKPVIELPVIELPVIELPASGTGSSGTGGSGQGTTGGGL